MATQNQQTGQNQNLNQNQQNRSWQQDDELEAGSDKSTVQPAGKEAPQQDARQIKQATSQNEDFNTDESDELMPDDMDLDEKQDWSQQNTNTEKNPRH
ncbi:hypothetical protein ACLSU7_00930 [Bdellovibrio sp. HCB185ZH]|uniref:hypothetical protein n=1 Tax=Bdellovibrio sp. HCB185ZH TaxID=3394235 RepID=UPI0039A707AE